MVGFVLLLPKKKLILELDRSSSRISFSLSTAGRVYA